MVIIVIIAIVTVVLVLTLGKGKVSGMNGLDSDGVFIFIQSGVNSELIGTYAFITNENNEGTYDIIALKKDNSTVKIATTEYSDWQNGIDNLFYSDGKLYYLYSDDIEWSIDLNKGNGNYELVKYKFLEGYITYSNSWFYAKNGNVYFISGPDLFVCDLNSTDCEMQNIDIRQGSDLTIDGKYISKKYKDVYIDNDLNIYLYSEDKENLYKLDPSKSYEDMGLVRASYQNINKLGEDAHIVTSQERKEASNYKVTHEYNEYSTAYVTKKDGSTLKYEHCYPITLLSGNYLLVAEGDSLFSTKTKFIDLNTNETVDKLFDFDYYSSNIWFVENN